MPGYVDLALVELRLLPARCVFLLHDVVCSCCMGLDELLRELFDSLHDLT